jgi:hypothetical protein
MMGRRLSGIAVLALLCLSSGCRWMCERYCPPGSYHPYGGYCCPPPNCCSPCYPPSGYAPPPGGADFSRPYAGGNVCCPP